MWLDVIAGTVLAWLLGLGAALVLRRAILGRPARTWEAVLLAGVIWLALFGLFFGLWWWVGEPEAFSRRSHVGLLLVAIAAFYVLGRSPGPKRSGVSSDESAASDSTASHHRRTLNGYQRIWVVASLTFALVAAVYTFVAWPPISDEYAELLQEQRLKSPRNLFLDIAIADLGQGKPVDEVVSGFNLPDSTTFRSEVAQVAQLARVRQRERGSEVAAFAALMAITGSVCLYVIGWAAAWIRRGFSANEA